METGQKKHNPGNLPVELAPLALWLQRAAQNSYGASGDNGKVWVLPESFGGVFGVAFDRETINLYCQNSELEWLSPAGACSVAHVVGGDGNGELLFWFMDKIAFVLPVPLNGGVRKVALYRYPDDMSQPVREFLVPEAVDQRCCWPVSSPRFHFLP